MAITARQRRPDETNAADFRFIIADITLDTSYPVGGSPGLAALLGLSSVFAVIQFDRGGAAPQYTVGYSPETDKLRVFDGAQIEVAATAALNTVTIKALIIGK